MKVAAGVSKIKVSAGTSVAGCNQNTSRIHVDVCFVSRSTQREHTLTERLLRIIGQVWFKSDTSQCVLNELSHILTYLVCILVEGPDLVA